MIRLLSKLLAHDAALRVVAIRYWTRPNGHLYDLRIDLQHAVSGDRPQEDRDDHDDHDDGATDQHQTHTRAPGWFRDQDSELVVLHEGECITRVHEFYASDESLVGLELETNLARVVPMGTCMGTKVLGDVVQDAHVVAIKLKRRGDALKLMSKATITNKIRRSQVVFRSLPTIDKLKGRYAKLQAAARAKGAFTTTASRLDEQVKTFVAMVGDTIKDLAGLSARGIVSVGCLVASLLSIMRRAKREVAPLLGGMLTKVDERRSMLEAITADLMDLRAVVVRYNKAEIKACVKTSSLIRHVMQTVTASNCEALVTLQAAHPRESFDCAHPHDSFKFSITDNLLAYFANIGNVDRFAHVATVHARAYHSTLGEAVTDLVLRMPVVQLAIAKGNVDLLVWIISHTGLDPSDLPPLPLGALAAYVAVDELELDAPVPELIRQNRMNQEAVQLVVDQLQRRREFARRAIDLFKRNGLISMDELTALVKDITVVWHLPLIYMLGKVHLSRDDLKQLFSMAVEHTVETKLVVSEEAYSYFKELLEQAKAQSMLTKHEYDVITLRAEIIQAKIRAEDANAATNTLRIQLREIREQELPSIRKELASVRRAVIGLQAQNVCQDRRDRQLAFVSAILSAAGIPGLDLLGKCLDMCDPMNLLCSMVPVDAENERTFVQDPTYELVVRNDVKNALASRFGVEAELLAKVLRRLGAPVAYTQKLNLASAVRRVMANERRCRRH
ncbi:hypothetical protein Poli38472_007042 [Pythium oligandrum]|uniref:Uncharacterized protein n=1 Tax=Pythium oligandrum TaxID=41045 RepID=A0A8K1C984_PYTOL|nr:hypothetical protein Poli38472_007042 [Pythium oligandrum]|eukprot:TMW58897.1 hypothetical protein Poli38472_007042 [Pythium oligandrum]